jgi:Trk K+ transport system NAD-binding subunit
MTKAGVPRKIAMKISGHKTEAVFERYNIDTDEDIREAMEMTVAYVQNQPTQSNVVPFDQEARAAK